MFFAIKYCVCLHELYINNSHKATDIQQVQARN
jgi:hypothetical protein